MADFKLSFPNLRAEDMGDARQMRRLLSYLQNLNETLAFMFANLDEENMSAELIGNITGMQGRLEELQGRLEELEAALGQETED